MSSPELHGIARLSALDPASGQADWGYIADGSLVATSASPQAIYRIASMTKSFTATAVLALAAGLIPAKTRLVLDAPVIDYAPELSTPGLTGVTVRDALTMSSSLVTDNAWADRQESMNAAQFTALFDAPLLSDGWPGTSYAYSNLSYAVLGRVVEHLTGRACTEVVETEIIRRLGMVDTGFDYRELDADRIVPGYRMDAAGQRHLEPLTTPGAFSPIGGLLSTVADIAIWVRTLIAAHRPDAPRDGWSRVYRDLQHGVRMITAGRTSSGAAAELYAHGIHHRHDSELGDSFYHSGGYPGYGSHMRWHPASGTGAILLGARTYFPAEDILAPIFEEQLRADGVGRQTSNVDGPAADVTSLIRQRAEAVADLLFVWDDSLVEGIAASNLLLDIPAAERRLAHAALVAGHSASRESVRIEILGSAQARIWLSESVQAHITLAPCGRVQQIIPPDESRSLPVKADSK